MSTAVITGANSPVGIGFAFAKLLSDKGYTVYAVDRDHGEGLKALGTEAHTATLDVTSPESIQKFKESLGDTTVDILLNVAGIAAGPEKDGLTTSNLDILERTFAVNTFGALLLTQALLPNILKSSSPKIGIVSSRVGSIGDNSTGGHYAYRASKAAVNSVGKSLAMDLKDKGVVVMLLHPGFVRTNILPKDTMPPEAVEADEAARKLWDNIVSKKEMGDTGKFWHREGYELPW
ncbi:3-oxoacyl-reductase [Exophiala viscosa]|uniref:3-oxoacyl-reductase n=1 Tax=Exophiala viscosa TaxID=2486360 RepID=A0AAN6DN38_9EURO|nr:3-oxoacyl-reductase [Exophiala viscosa]